MSGNTTQWWLRWDTRNSRSQWWIVQVPVYIVSAIVATITRNNDHGLWTVIALVISLAMAYLYFASNARRFHDRGKSGWWSLIGIVPIIGTLWILIELGFLAGDSGPNQWGPPPA